MEVSEQEDDPAEIPHTTYQRNNRLNKEMRKRATKVRGSIC